MRLRSPDPPGRPTAPSGARPPAAARGLREQTARDLTSGDGHVQHFLAALGPRVELVGLVAIGPALQRLLLLSREPEGAPQLEVRLDQVGTQREGLSEERLGILEHLPFK